MKGKYISSFELDAQIRKVVNRTALRSRTETHLRQKSCLDSSLATEKLPVGVQLLSRKFKRLLGYLVLIHYYPMEPGVYCFVLLDFQEFVEEIESFWLSVLMDKSLFLKWLEIQKTITTQQFFSGIVNERNLNSLKDEIVFRFEEKLNHPRRTIRRKGYRDKGSRARDDFRALKTELGNDFFLKEYQLELEEKRKTRSDKLLLLKDYLTEGRVLTDELLVEFRILPRKEVPVDESEGSSSAEDYCKRRAKEKTLREERKARRAAEKLRIQNFQSETDFEKSGENGRKEDFIKDLTTELKATNRC